MTLSGDSVSDDAPTEVPVPHHDHPKTSQHQASTANSRPAGTLWPWSAPAWPPRQAVSCRRAQHRHEVGRHDCVCQSTSACHGIGCTSGWFEAQPRACACPTAVHICFWKLWGPIGAAEIRTVMWSPDDSACSARRNLHARVFINVVGGGQRKPKSCLA